MQKQIVLLTVCFFACFFVFAAGCTKTPSYECNDKISCVTVAPDAPVRIGVIQALTGKVATLGKDQIRGIELALDKVSHKLMGHQIVLQTEDELCSGEGGANAAIKITADPQIIAVIGTTCSGAAATASKIISEAGLTMISGNNSAPFLTSVGGKHAPKWQPGYFRTASNEETSGLAAASYVFEKKGIRKAAAINDGDIYTKGLTEGFIKKFEEQGGKIVLNAAVNKGDTDMKPVLTAVKDSGAELLFFPLFQPEANLILLEIKQTPGMEKIILMSDGALVENTFIEAMKEKASGMYFVGPKPPKGPECDMLASEYKSKYKEAAPTIYYLSAYDAADILLNAIEKAAVRDDDGTLHIGRQAIRNAIRLTSDFHGVSGRLNCNRFGDCAFPEFNVMRLDDPAAGIEGLKSNTVFTYKPKR